MRRLQAPLLPPCRIGHRLQLDDELDKFWGNHHRLGPLQRWMSAIDEVVLPNYPGNLVIFIDEIDAVRSLHIAQSRRKSTANRGWIRSLSFSPDGRGLAVGYADGTIELYQADGYPGRIASKSAR